MAGAARTISCFLLHRISEFQDSFGCLSHPLLPVAIGALEFAQTCSIEACQQFLSSANSLAVESSGKALIHAVHEGDIAILLCLRPTTVGVPAAEAFRPAHRLVGFRRQLLDCQKSLQFPQSGCPAVVWDRHDFACASVDLQSLGSSAATPFEEPAIKLDLQQNLGVILFVDSASHLRISNHIAVAIEDEVVGNADNFDIGSAKFFPYKKGRLIQSGNFLLYCVRSLSHVLVERSSAHVDKRPESRQMISLVSESKPSQDDVVRAGFRFLLSLVAQENTQVAACGTMA